MDRPLGIHDCLTVLAKLGKDGTKLKVELALIPKLLKFQTQKSVSPSISQLAWGRLIALLDESRRLGRG